MMARLVDELKSRGITAFLTSLTTAGLDSEVNVSSLIDTWLLLRDIESLGERNRALYVLKSRGMPHSNQVREFLITGKGLRLSDIYVGPAGIFDGFNALRWEFLVNQGGVLLHKEDEFFVDTNNNAGVAVLTQAPASEYTSDASAFAALRQTLAMH